MREKEVRGLMEAYSQVHAPQELTEDQVWEEVETWVNSLIEEGHDLSEYTWEEMYEAYLEEAPMTAFQAAGGNAKLAQLNKGRSPRAGRATAQSIEKQGQENLFKAGGGNAAIAKGPTRSQNVRGGGTRQVSTLTRQDIINKGTVAAAKPVTPSKPKVSNIPPAEGTGRGGPSDIRRGSTPTPSAPAAKPAAAAPKPTTPITPAKPAGSAMDQWAKANPKLAAAKAERDRTRGTSATTNPLMKDMKSSMPAPKSPAPSTAKTGFDLAKKGVNLAAGADLFDIVKGYLLDEGYADSEDAAMVIMVNMSEEWRESILEGKMELSRETRNKMFRRAGNLSREALKGGDEGSEAHKKSGKIVKALNKDAEENDRNDVNESQYARENPEKYERDERRSQSSRERRMNDPKTGINSPAFKAFMAQQMGGKKKKED